MTKKLLYLAAAAASLAAVPAYADVVVPSAQATTEGNSASSDLFGMINIGRYQQVYSAAEFGASPVLLTSLAFRTNGVSTGNLFEGVGRPTTRIFEGSFNLSTTSKAVDGLSTNFAANRGADALDVIGRGDIVFSTAAAMDGDVRAFDVVFNFDNPFLYDPSAGNLLLDINDFSGGSVFSNGTPLDAQFTPGDSVSNLYVTNSNTNDGRTSTKGYITKFGAGVAAVPEPATWAMMLVGFGLIGGTLRRRRVAGPALA